MSIFFIFILGLFLGSFLNVLIDRLPRNERITGRSYCEFCKAELKWYDLIPVLSFVYLRGKCRYCHTPFSYQYPFIELITGALFVLTYILVSGGIFNFQFSPLRQGFEGQVIFNEFINHKSLIINLFYSLFIVSVMIVIFFADLKYGIIPDKVLIAGVIVSSIFLFINNQQLIINHLLSAFGAFLFMLFIYVVTKGKGMGFGDVKFSFLIGLILGFPGVFYSIYLTFLTGGALAIILILWKKKKLKSQIAFGPFLVVNFLIALFFQPQLRQVFSLLLS